MNHFETTTEKLQKYFRRGLMFIVAILSFLLYLQIEILKQHHEMERQTNKKYNN